MPEDIPFTITRTIYDPASKDFVFDSGEVKALPSIRDWINDHNPVIYWYILRIDNPTDSDISQWAVELYTHQALTITEAYIEGSDRRFLLKKRERDAWSEKYVLSIPKQMGIPIVGKGTKRLYFKIDINCKEGLMHEYGISGMFMAHGLKEAEIKEKTFQYSCKVGEFRQIFDSNPDEASVYAEKRLKGKYSSNSVHIFTNSFRMIYELNRYCHSHPVDQDMLISKLQMLQANFEKVPEIASERIMPLIRYELEQLESLLDRSSLTPRLLNMCDKLVEYLHIEVMEGEVKSAHQHSTLADHMPKKELVNASQKECPVCGNVITESNKSLICMKCRSRFCLTCEEWFRDVRKRGEKPLCEKCFDEERQKEEAEKKAEAERLKQEQERLLREEERVRIQREKERKANTSLEEANRYFSEKKFDESKKSYEEARTSFKKALELAEKRDFSNDREKIIEALDSIETSIEAVLLSKGDDILNGADDKFKDKKFPASERDFTQALEFFSTLTIRRQELEDMVMRGKDGLIRAQLEQGKEKKVEWEG